MAAALAQLSMLAAALLGQVFLVSVVSGACPSDKFTVVANHSACLPVSPYADVSRSVMLPGESTTIVNYHNNLRKVPIASDMQVMVWDPELAMVAQSWASNCYYAHDGGPRRGIPGKYAVGQNIAFNTGTIGRNWNYTLAAWGNESRYFQYGVAVTKVVGHYTQMVWAYSTKVGCGVAFCSTLSRSGSTPVNNAYYYVCNYAPAGNISPNQYKPYTQAVSPGGQQCPNKFVNGLCDCGGKTCYNGGTLNLNTCTCTCSASFHFLPNCDLNCTKATTDPSYCSTNPVSNCGLYFNWPYLCPNTCSWCPLAGAA